MASGIYCFKNRVTGACYIGKANDIGSRIWQHIRNLEGQKHHALHFQDSYNQHGLTAFVIEVLETCDPDKTAEREIHFMRTFKPELNSNRPDLPPEERAKRLRETTAVPIAPEIKPVCECGNVRPNGMRCCRKCHFQKRVAMHREGYLRLPSSQKYNESRAEKESKRRGG